MSQGKGNNACVLEGDVVSMVIYFGRECRFMEIGVVAFLQQL